MNPLKVELVTWTRDPLGTLFFIWEQSRSNDPLACPEAIQNFIEEECGNLAMYDAGMLHNESEVPTLHKRITDTVNGIIDEDIPVTENISFTFAIYNISISLREQLVRHRIGNHIGPLVGMDIIPDLAEETFWSQTSRVVRQDTFFDDGRYILPESVEALDNAVPNDGKFHVSPMKVYNNIMEECQRAYVMLVKAGVPVEDARQVIPQGACHNLTWTVNLKALSHIMAKRSCWVAQVGMWEPLLSGMVDELCEKVDPIFRKLLRPPCFRRGEYHSCPYSHINAERIQGRDGMPPCPMYVYNETQGAYHVVNSTPPPTPPVWHYDPSTAIVGTKAVNLKRDIRDWRSANPNERDMLMTNITKFEKLWKLNVLTGKPL